MGVPYTAAALKAELNADPRALGYAARLAVHDYDGLAALLNAPDYWAYPPLSAAQVLKWGASSGVRLAIAQAAAATGNFATGGSTPAAAATQAIALVVEDMLRAGVGLDVTDPAVVGVLSTGVPYTPGSVAGGVTLQAAGLLDALVAASILGTPTSPLKDALINAGRVPASRATVLWGYGYATNPVGPAAVTIDRDRILAALRS